MRDRQGLGQTDTPAVHSSALLLLKKSKASAFIPQRWILTFWEKACPHQNPSKTAHYIASPMCWPVLTWPVGWQSTTSFFDNSLWHTLTHLCMSLNSTLHSPASWVFTFCKGILKSVEKPNYIRGDQSMFTWKQVMASSAFSLPTVYSIRTVQFKTQKENKKA